MLNKMRKREYEKLNFLTAYVAIQACIIGKTPRKFTISLESDIFGVSNHTFSNISSTCASTDPEHQRLRKGDDAELILLLHRIAL